MQFRLESPVTAVSGDSFIIRSYSPPHTIAGGRVLDPQASRHRRSDLHRVSETLRTLSRASDDLPPIIVQLAGDRGIGFDAIRSRTGIRSTILRERLDEAVRGGEIVDAGSVLLSVESFERLLIGTLDAIATHHQNERLSRGISRETLRDRTFRHVEPELFRAVTNELERRGKIVFDEDVFRLVSHETTLSAAEKKTFDMLREMYSKAALEAPKLDDALRAASGTDAKLTRKVFQLLVDSGEMISVTTEFYFTASVLVDLAEKLRLHSQTSGDAMIDVPKFKEIAGVSRKYAIPLLEYFDRTRVTRRVGDKRQIL